MDTDNVMQHNASPTPQGAEPGVDSKPLFGIQLAELEAADRLRGIAAAQWELLGDIDTASDMLKPNGADIRAMLIDLQQEVNTLRIDVESLLNTILSQTDRSLYMYLHKRGRTYARPRNTPNPPPQGGKT